jgi:hypothetical protein
VKHGPPLPLAAYKAYSPFLLAGTWPSAGSPWLPPRGTSSIEPPLANLSAPPPPWTSTPTYRAICCPAGDAATSEHVLPRRLPPCSTGRILRWPLCPNRPQESGLGDLLVALRPRPADHGRRLAGIWPQPPLAMPKGPHCKPVRSFRVLYENQGHFCEESKVPGSCL